MNGRIGNRGTTALLLRDFRLSPEALESKYEELVKRPDIELLEKEFTALSKMSVDKSLSKDEKLRLEKCKLLIMKAVQDQLLKATHAAALAAEKPPKKASFFRYFVFVAFLLLEFVPMIWGSYLGITALMATAPWLPPAVITGAGLLVCGIEAILYYAVKGPLLKRALKIFMPERADPCLGIYEKQLQTLKNIDQILLADNKINSEDYALYARLARLFCQQVGDLKTYAIYVKTSFEDPEINHLKEKALIVVGDKIGFITNKGLIKNKDGSYLTTTLAPKEKSQLYGYERQRTTGKVLRIPDNLEFLDQVINKVTSAVSLETKIKKFKEGVFKKGLRWILSGVDMSLNIGGGYFLATSLLAGTAAALLGTPLGWCIIGVIILGQFALRLAVGSNAMFNMLNPGAEKHKKVKEEINDYELKTEKYKEILATKKLLVKYQHQEEAKTNAHVDTYTGSYLNSVLYKNARVLPAKPADTALRPIMKI